MKPSSSSTSPPPALFDELFTSPAMAAVFSDRAYLQGLLDFEAALAHAEADVGAIPSGAAEAIFPCCRSELFDQGALAAGAAAAGNLAIPVVRALTDLVTARDAAAARSVHWGATSQDAIDTGMVLQLRAALDIFAADLRRFADVLARLAQQHRRTVLLGRTWLQAGPPVTLGLKVAGWLAAVERHRDRLSELRTRVLVIQFGGAVGTLASLGAQALPIAARLGQILNLDVPDLPWHSHRDRVAETGAVLGLLAGTLGKIARDISLLMQTEVAEVFEPGAPARGGSSTMPHKRNPVGAAAILAAATRVPGLVSTLLCAMPQEHERGLGGWQVEWETLPQICLLTAGALKHALEVCEGLEVDAGRMQANLDATLGVVLAEPVALALARSMDRAAASALVEQACRRATAERKPLREVLREAQEVTRRLAADELDRLCDPTSYLGLAEVWIDRVLAAHARQPRRGKE
jgi:3-carboxy-cis,cis-muconate cycloisomerase